MTHSKSEAPPGVDRRSVMLGVAATLAAASRRYAAAQPRPAADPLASWNEGRARDAIRTFVRATTDPSSPTVVKPEDRIATFDQDGTLWVEQPIYAQAMFAIHRVHVLAPTHPEWRNREPFRAVLADDKDAMAKFSERDWAEIVFLTHSDMSQAAFLEIVRQWIATAEHPRFKRHYTELVYQPMLEVMAYLRGNGFKTYIVTGGGQDFVRAYADRIYGVPPEQIIGSSVATKFETNGGKPEVMRLPKLFFDDDHAGKVLGIDLFIGKRPGAAFGNSTGDREMLQWTGAGEGARLKMLVHHDDNEREYAYGPAGGLPDTKVGTFSQSLMDEARSDGWTVISMKRDWKRIFAFS